MDTSGDQKNLNWTCGLGEIKSKWEIITFWIVICFEAYKHAAWIEIGESLQIISLTK